jgi:hypothetical protein
MSGKEYIAGASSDYGRRDEVFCGPAASNWLSTWKQEAAMNVATTEREGSGTAPRALIGLALGLADLVALPLIALAFMVVLGTAIVSLGVAAGGINFVAGLRFLDYFPTFPTLARIPGGLSLLAFSTLLALSTLFLWRLFRTAWRVYWSWHHSAWQRTFATFPALYSHSRARQAHSLRRPLALCGLVFLGLFAITFVLMTLMGGFGFWHVWGWFT